MGRLTDRIRRLARRARGRLPGLEAVASAAAAAGDPRALLTLQLDDKGRRRAPRGVACVRHAGEPGWHSWPGGRHMTGPGETEAPAEATA
jgi:hypothetical protein